MKIGKRYVLSCVICVLPAFLTAQVGLQSPRGGTSPSGLQSNIVAGQNFDGIGQNSFGYTDPFVPPDPAGAVGITQYVEWVNTAIAVFNKSTGEIVSGPTNGNQIWMPMGGPCATYNDGQAVVQFDKLASRWVIGQLVLHGPPYYFCVAVSTTSDATGNYSLYSIALNDVPDSPRLGTWPDAYYLTFNMYSQGLFQYANVCALDRSSLLNGQTPRGPLCQQTSSQHSSLLPADLDGTMLPPSGSPNYLFSLGHNAIDFWTYHTDFSQGISQLNGPTPISVQPFSPACSAINCIPQEGTPQRLTALSDRLMYRAAYRNFGDHESVTLNHTVIFDLRFAAIRWYELRNPSTLPSPSLYQQGTYVPTSIDRWMGNLAMDAFGDIGATYNLSSAALHPSLGFTDRLAGDPLNLLRGENLQMQGSGSQTSGVTWGNSTSLSVDPVDDCTFWSAGEYLRSDGTNNWNTRIGSFSLNRCPSTNPGIQITSAPPFGQNGSITGTVSNVQTTGYEVGVLLFIPGFGWWTKPTCNGSSANFVPIDPSNNTWSAWVGSGGAGDFTATKYAAYLVPQGATGVCQMGYDGLPYDLESISAARDDYQRPNPQPPLTFAGQQWEVTDSQALALNPGPCWFSHDNAFTDSSGNLHLTITNDSGTWHCAQVAAPLQQQQGQQVSQSYGYGTYTFNLASADDGLDPNIVFGLFSWSDDPAYAPYVNGSFLQTYSPWANSPFADQAGSGIVPSHSELDVEFSRWGNSGSQTNAQFCVQPYTTNPCHQFMMPAGYNNSTAVINWLPDGITFQVQDPNGHILAQYNYPGPVPPPGDNGGWMGMVPNLQQVRLNLWLYHGQQPQNGQNAEVIVSNFTYAPYNQ